MKDDFYNDSYFKKNKNNLYKCEKCGITASFFDKDSNHLICKKCGYEMMIVSVESEIREWMDSKPTFLYDQHLEFILSFAVKIQKNNKFLELLVAYIFSQDEKFPYFYKKYIAEEKSRKSGNDFQVGNDIYEIIRAWNQSQELNDIPNKIYSAIDEKENKYKKDVCTNLNLIVIASEPVTTVASNGYNENSILNNFENKINSNFKTVIIITNMIKNDKASPISHLFLIESFEFCIWKFKKGKLNARNNVNFLEIISKILGINFERFKNNIEIKNNDKNSLIFSTNFLEFVKKIAKVYKSLSNKETDNEISKLLEKKDIEEIISEYIWLCWKSSLLIWNRSCIEIIEANDNTKIEIEFLAPTTFSLSQINQIKFYYKDKLIDSSSIISIIKKHLRKISNIINRK